MAAPCTVASQRKETEVSGISDECRDQIWWISQVGDERVSVDKIKNHQEMNMPVLEKTVHASPAEKPLSMRKKRFEL